MYSEEYERNDHVNNSDGSEQVIEFAMLLWYSNKHYLVKFQNQFELT